MILIADSGSTKTDWRLIDKQLRITQFQTSGFNPFFQDEIQIAYEIASKLVPNLKLPPGIEELTIYYYGTGCSTPLKKEVIHKALASNFQKASINIESDLFGAAKALCGNQEGIACILGTGSNSCHYDGKNIVENIASFGYLFGDYGSGAHIGKTLIQAYFDNKLPLDLKKIFEARTGNTREDILESIYKKDFPNRYLAAFSKFVFQHINHPFMIGLVRDCFRSFFETNIEKYTKYQVLPVHAVGSIAFYYNAIFKSVAEEKGIRVGTILETPISALALYHSNL